MAAFVARFGYPIMTPNLVEGFEQPLTFKNKNNGSNKTQNGPENCRTVPKAYNIIIYVYGYIIYM